MRGLFAFIVFIHTSVFSQSALSPIGTWREHLPYGSTIDVAASATKIYAATPYSLFSVNPATNEVERMSKISGLSETGISAIEFDKTSNKLFVGYSNSNIDVLDEKGIHNIADLKRSNLAGNKSIYDIYPDNQFCYLATGLGIILMDAVKYEIKDSWFIGNGGAYRKTYMISKDDTFFYAATEEGLKKASLNANLADFHSWKTVLATGCKGVVNLQNQIIAWQHDSLFIQKNGHWNLFFANGWPVVAIHASVNVLTICQRTASGDSKVVILKADGTIEKIIQQPNVISFPKNAIVANGVYWVADFYGGLSQWSGNSFEQYKLNSPEDIATGEMTVYNNVLYATAGSVNNAWNYQYNSNGIYQLKDGVWTNYNRFHFPQLDSMLDFITIAVDPRDESVWAGSYGGGLLHIKGANQFDIYKQQSSIGSTIGDPTSYRVAGLAFDQDNNLWIANYGAGNYLHVLKNDGNWVSFTTPFSLTENAVSRIVIDDMNQKWIISPKGNGLICFNSGNSLENTNDDHWKLYTSGKGNGNLPSSDVLSIAKDKSGFIWVGTSDGVAVIQCLQDVFTSSGCEALLPVIQQSSITNYLFKGEAVQDIAVDGADRKWIATQNGVWLINSEGDQVLLHFTEDNSSLLSNNVKSIAINGNTGEVFFGTSNGICSYRSTATEPAAENTNVLIFPNPVPPGYSGTIAIHGLQENSYIKITELNGRLVYQTKALGGQAVWNGKDYKGNTVSSGIYLVLVIDEARQAKAVGKIVFISK